MGTFDHYGSFSMDKAHARSILILWDPIGPACSIRSVCVQMASYRFNIDIATFLTAFLTYMHSMVSVLSDRLFCIWIPQWI